MLSDYEFAVPTMPGDATTQDTSNFIKNSKFWDKKSHLEPNVLVFSLNNNSTSQDLSNKMQHQLNYFLSSDCYTVYDLDMDNFMNDVWQDVTTCLCFIDFETECKPSTLNLIVDKILEYSETGGRVFLLTDDDKEQYVSKILLDRILSKEVNQSENESYQLFRFPESGSILLPYHGRKVLHDSSLLNDILVELGLTVVSESSSSMKQPGGVCSSLHLLAANQQDGKNFLSQFLDPEYDRGKFYTMAFHMKKSSTGDDEASVGDSVPLFVHELGGTAVSGAGLDLDKYMSHLNTDTLGRIILHTDVIDSSFSAMQSILPNLSPDCGLVITSVVQTKGRGRSGNKWISPIGTALFTFHVTLSTDSFLGQHSSLVQHLAALAVVLACKKCSRGTKVDLAVKWPNDVYLRNVGKVAGVLVRGSHFGDYQRFIIGCGINVSNDRPTVCLHGAIKSQSSVGDSPYYPSIEEIIAETLNQFETSLNTVGNSKSGMNQIMQTYIENWMHSGQIVKVSSEVSDVLRNPIFDSPQTLNAKVVGIDHFGFLQVEHVDTFNERRIYSIHPDGNSFDMMRNLILPKD